MQRNDFSLMENGWDTCAGTAIAALTRSVAAQVAHVFTLRVTLSLRIISPLRIKKVFMAYSLLLAGVLGTGNSDFIISDCRTAERQLTQFGLCEVVAANSLIILKS